MEPASYVDLLHSGDLQERVDRAAALLSPCRVCPRQCQADRSSDERGYCGGGNLPAVSSSRPHFGEEPPLSGRSGSGTIFFSGCNMRCAFCQNHTISQERGGRDLSPEQLAGMMLGLQDRGCHNINLVTPSHFVPQILSGVLLAARRGLCIPLAYNTGTYDSVETLRLLEGIVDIYLPDMKYENEVTARLLSDAPGYPAIMEHAVTEMQRQVGDLVISDGIAVRGLLIRHLILPGNLADSDRVMRFIGEEVSTGAYVNIMDQYHPCGRILSDAGVPFRALLARQITREEYRYAAECAGRYGILRGYSLS